MSNRSARSILLVICPSILAAQTPIPAAPLMDTVGHSPAHVFRLVPLNRTTEDTTRWSVRRRVMDDSSGAGGLQVMRATRRGGTTTDSVRFNPVTLALQWERSSLPSAVQKRGVRLIGTVDSGPNRKAVDTAAPDPIYSSTMDALVIQHLPLADRYSAVLEFWSGDHLEQDTVRVRGREAHRWVVDFAEPYALETLWIDGTSHEVVRHLYTWRRDGTQSEVLRDP